MSNITEALRLSMECLDSCIWWWHDERKGVNCDMFYTSNDTNVER